MTPQDLDRILDDNAAVEPSSAFSARVMRAVRADAAARSADLRAWKSWWPVLAALSILVPLMIAAQAIDTAVPVANLSIPLERLVAVTFGSTFALTAWCAGLLRDS